MDEEILIVSSMSKLRFLAAAVVPHLQKLMGAHGSCSKQNKASPLAPSCNVGELGFLLTCSSGPAPWPGPDPSRPRVFKKTKKTKKTKKQKNKQKNKKNKKNKNKNEKKQTKKRNKKMLPPPKWQ